MPLGTASDDWRYDGAALQSRLWTPKQFSADKLSVWYDWSNIQSLTLDSSQGTSQINDLSGNANHATQINASQKPLVRLTGKVNVCPTRIAEQNGASTTMALATSLAYSAGNGISVAVAANYNGTNTTSFCGGGAGAFQLRWDNSTSGAVELVRRANASLLTGSNVAATGGMNVVGAEAATNLCAVWLNGTRTANATNPAFTANFLDIFASAGEYFTGSIGEILIFNSSILTTRERGLVDGYLAWKWGVREKMAVTHPFLTRPPLIGD